MSPGAPDPSRADGTRVLAPLGAAATRVVVAGTLYLRIGRQLRAFHRSPVTIGRAADCDFVIDRPELAPHAMRLHFGPGGVWMEPMSPPHDAAPGIPRRVEAPCDLHLTRGIVLRIGTEPPAARTGRLPVLVLLGGVLLLAIAYLTRPHVPHLERGAIAAPAVQPTRAVAAPLPSPESAAAAPAASTARLSEAAPPAAVPTKPSTSNRHRLAPTATATDAEDVRRLDQAEFWIARGLPQRARPLLDTLPSDPALAKRLRSLRAELRRQAEELRVQARAVSAIDPDAAHALRRQAAELLFPDDPLYLVLERELP